MRTVLDNKTNIVNTAALNYSEPITLTFMVPVCLPSMALPLCSGDIIVSNHAHVYKSTALLVLSAIYFYRN